MDDPGKTCDICKLRLPSSNGLIRYQDPVDGDFIVFRKKTKTKLKTRDCCGHTCMIKAFNNWLVAVHVNAPAEVKKDEIQN